MSRDYIKEKLYEGGYHDIADNPFEPTPDGPLGWPSKRANKNRQQPFDGPVDEPPVQSPADFGLPVDEPIDDDQNIAPIPHKKSLVAFPLVSFKDIRLDTTQRNYRIKGLLPRRGLVIIWGPKKCYKSFIASDMGYHVALGWRYRGCRVEQALVIYIALEGREGQPARKEAFAKHYNVNDAPFLLMTKPLNLIKQAAALIKDIEAQLLERRDAPGVVFIDTLNRSLVGSESKDEDMAAYLNAAAMIEERFKCLVVIVHHCGIDTSRPRGHSALPAAVDVQLRVDRTDKLQATLTVELAKDFAEGTEFFYQLKIVELGLDPDGDPITSLVVLPLDETGPQPAKTKSVKGLGAAQKNALNALTECVAEHGIDPPQACRLPATVKVVTLDQWQEQLFRSGVLSRKTAEGKRQNWAAILNRLRNTLLERHHIGILDDFVWRV
jgi:hypothetical protein